jgi:hypothetical protein
MAFAFQTELQLGCALLDQLLEMLAVSPQLDIGRLQTVSLPLALDVHGEATDEIADEWLVGRVPLGFFHREQEEAKMPVLGPERKDPNTGVARQSAGMTRVVFDVSSQDITVRALWCRLSVEAGTLGTRYAHGA